MKISADNDVAQFTEVYSGLSTLFVINNHKTFFV